MGKNNDTKLKAKFDAEREKTTNAIVKAIEENPLTWQKEWAAIAAVHNGISGHRYRGGNVWHLFGAMLANGFKDPRFCSYNQAKSAGYELKEGAKPCAIIEFWKRVSWPIKDDETGEITDWGHAMRPMKYTPVFNFEQFENAPEWCSETVIFTEDDATRTADEIIEKWVCPISEDDMSDRAYYSPMSDRIKLPSRRSFNNTESFLRTMLHEVTHSTGSKERLNRDIENKFGTPDYAFEELVAEIGAIFTASELGFKADGMDSRHFKNHAAYIQNWLEVLKSDKDYIFKAASKASAACDFIMEIIKDEGEEFAFVAA